MLVPGCESFSFRPKFGLTYIDLCIGLEAGPWVAAMDEANQRRGIEMSTQLYEFAKRFAAGAVATKEFADPFMDRWKRERDTSTCLGDSDDVSECLSSIFCLADLYNPMADRKEYELDEDGLRRAVSEILGRKPDLVQGVRSGNAGAG